MDKSKLPIEYNRSYPNGIPYVSIVIATYNKAGILDKTLSSIRQNVTDIPYEIIVVDDGSKDNTHQICRKHSVCYVWLDCSFYRNPSVPRNVACRTARGKILIIQSDDVLHSSSDIINKLTDLEKGFVNFASVWNVNSKHERLECYIHSIHNKRPLFFLGSIHRDDFWAIGGNDEDFTQAGYEDTYLGEVIKKNYKINWRDDILGFHQDHPRPQNLKNLVEESHKIYNQKIQDIL